MPRNQSKPKGAGIGLADFGELGFDRDLGWSDIQDLDGLFHDIQLFHGGADQEKPGAVIKEERFAARLRKPSGAKGNRIGGKVDARGDEEVTNHFNDAGPQVRVGDSGDTNAAAAAAAAAAAKPPPPPPPPPPPMTAACAAAAAEAGDINARDAKANAAASAAAAAAAAATAATAARHRRLARC